MLNIVVIDSDIANLHSCCKGLEFAGIQPIVSAQSADILAADGVVLPGVGAFDPAMQALRQKDLVAPLQELVAMGKPLLGICLGMQLLFESSEEGVTEGLGIVPGAVRRLRKEPDLPIPHMGWNQLNLTQPDHPLWASLPPSPWMYFVHSYYAEPTDRSWIAATATYGSQEPVAAIAKQGVMAVQFHPEKSAKDGLQILGNFVQYVRTLNQETFHV